MKALFGGAALAAALLTTTGCGPEPRVSATMKGCQLEVWVTPYSSGDVTVLGETKKADAGVVIFRFHVSQIGDADRITATVKGKVFDKKLEAPISFTDKIPPEKRQTCAAIVEDHQGGGGNKMKVKSALGNLDEAQPNPLFAIQAPPEATVRIAGKEIPLENGYGTADPIDDWLLAIDPRPLLGEGRGDVDIPGTIEITAKDGATVKEKVTVTASRSLVNLYIRQRLEGVAKGKPFPAGVAPSSEPSIMLADSHEGLGSWWLFGNPGTIGQATWVVVREKGTKTENGRTCSFEAGSSAQQILLESVVKVYDPRTAKVVAEQRFMAKSSQPCPAAMSFKVTESHKTFEAITPIEEIRPWLDKEFLKKKP